MNDLKPNRNLKNLLFDSDITLPEMEELKNQRVTGIELYQRKAESSPSKGFWTGTAFGRTLTGRNKTGKIVRRVGGTALATGLGLLGMPDAVTGVLTGGSGGSDLIAILNHIETILLLVGAILSGIGIGSDQMEIFQERLDEKEIMEGKDPLIRRVTKKLKPR